MIVSVHHVYSRVQVDRVIDGDTICVTIDLGFYTHRKETIRLWGINAPEMRGDERQKGIAARDHLIKLLQEEGPISIRTLKNRRGEDRTGSTGYLAILYSADGLDLTRQMVRDGHAVEISES